MQYHLFHQQGWPIGSGTVESANKLVVEARLKGAGMHWKRENVDPMLALRNIVCNDRWNQEWPNITQRLHQQVTQQRKLLRQEHCQAKIKSVVDDKHLTPLLEPPMEASPKPAVHEAQPKKRSGPWRPPPDHPWRRAPIGRARYQPPTPPKK